MSDCRGDGNPSELIPSVAVKTAHAKASPESNPERTGARACLLRLTAGAVPAYFFLFAAAFAFVACCDVSSACFF